MEVVPFLQRELSNIGIAINPSKTAALPPKGHVPTPEQIDLLEGIGVRIAERGGMKVVGVPVDTDEHAMESVMEIVRNGGAEQLARMLPRMPDKQAANLIATCSMVQRTANIERVMDPELSLPECLRADGNAMWMLEKLLDLPRDNRRNVVLRERVPNESVGLAALPTAAGKTDHGGRRVWTGVG